MSDNKAIKAKNMMYTQQLEHLPAENTDNLIELVEKKLQQKKYAVIIHDKCTDEKGNPLEPHIHLMLSFENARSINNVANILNDKSQYIEAWKGNSNNGYSYLVHATKDSLSKHQYDPSDVIANFDYLSELQKIVSEVANSKQKSNVQILLDALYDGYITKEALEKRLTGSEYGRIHKQIEEIWAKRLQNLANAWRKDMTAQGKKVQVVWIYGHAGTGKTSFAKEYAKKEGQEFYISGSSRDVFQKYSGEHTLVLDEFRPKSIPYQDLLRITDPFGIDEQVMAPSRYFDKALACDLIIITSPYNPLTFYNELFGCKFNPSNRDAYIDSFEQLLRRISLTIEMTNTEIQGMEYNHYKNDYVPIPATNRPNQYSSTYRPTPVTNAVDLYNAMFD